MNCVITIPGNGIGGYGRYKNDKTGPVKQFLVDNVYLYGKIFQHVRDCDVCDPEDTARFYLNRRKSLKFNGIVTGSLIDLAVKYEKLAKKKNLPFNPTLVNEFVCCYAGSNVMPEFDRLSLREIVDHTRFLKKHNGQFLFELCRIHPDYGVISKILENDNNSPISEEDLKMLISVAEIVTS